MLTLFFLFSACQSKYDRWRQSDIDRSPFTADKLCFYLPKSYSNFNQVRLSFQEAKKKQVLIFDTFNLPLVKKGSLAFTYKTASTEEKTLSLKPLKGGQRLVLSEEDSQSILKALSENKNVDIHFAHYKFTVTSEDFPRKAFSSKS